jgi:hypothetical protein
MVARLYSPLSFCSEETDNVHGEKRLEMCSRKGA